MVGDPEVGLEVGAAGVRGISDESSRVGGVYQIEFQATRNNQMELRAVSMGLRALQEPCEGIGLQRFEIRAGEDQPAGSAVEG